MENMLKQVTKDILRQVPGYYSKSNEPTGSFTKQGATSAPHNILYLNLLANR
ncbi:hypothetical protein COLO4_03407 [Corchorus olitorius]|uniref:Uncharacterized protein n=1 Tax=Corchorus olitorius TaxID=93759 RepID=A0A1R3KYN2_9ROSI|nr:hypothetical protein COLO4_03407 [Corchorus olitorius]